jgi:hypothetical protein
MEVMTPTVAMSSRTMSCGEVVAQVAFGFGAADEAHHAVVGLPAAAFYGVGGGEGHGQHGGHHRVTTGLSAWRM